jgi:hypothetical protein
MGLGEKGDKRLRWAVVLGTRRADDEEYKGYPIGDPAADLVQDDATLARWVERMKPNSVSEKPNSVNVNG